MGLHRLRTRISVLYRVLDGAAFDSDAGKHFYVMTKGAHASLGSRFGAAYIIQAPGSPSHGTESRVPDAGQRAAHLFC